jgi:hypothetical protein
MTSLHVHGYGGSDKMWLYSLLKVSQQDFYRLNMQYEKGKSRITTRMVSYANGRAGWVPHIIQ